MKKKQKEYMENRKSHIGTDFSYSQYYSIQDDGAASGPDDTNFIYGNKECIGFGSR